MVALGLPFLFWISVTFLALFSLCGDRVEISPKLRLPVQFIAALVLVAFSMLSDPSVVFCPLLSDLRPLTSVLCLLLLSVFIVGTANYYNFMDGINGIAGITGIVVFGLIVLFGILSGGMRSSLSLPFVWGWHVWGSYPLICPGHGCLWVMWGASC